MTSRKSAPAAAFPFAAKPAKTTRCTNYIKALVNDDIKNRETPQVFNHHNDPTGKKEYAQIQLDHQFDMDNHRAVQLSKIAYLQRKIREEEMKIEVMEKVMEVLLCTGGESGGGDGM